MPPISTRHRQPPGQSIDRAGFLQAFAPLLRHLQMKHEGPAVALRVGPVTRRGNKRPKVPVRHRGQIDSKRGEANFPHRPLAIFRPDFGPVAPHEKSATVQICHRPGINRRASDHHACVTLLDPSVHRGGRSTRQATRLAALVHSGKRHPHLAGLVVSGKLSVRKGWAGRPLLFRRLTTG